MGKIMALPGIESKVCKPAPYPHDHGAPHSRRPQHIIMINKKQKYTQHLRYLYVIQYILNLIHRYIHVPVSFDIF